MINLFDSKYLEIYLHLQFILGFEKYMGGGWIDIVFITILYWIEI